MLNTIKNFANDESGATLVEYSILIALIAAATITAVNGVAGTITTRWQTLNTNWAGLSLRPLSFLPSKRRSSFELRRFFYGRLSRKKIPAPSRGEAGMSQL